LATGRRHQAALLLAQSRAAADNETVLRLAGEAQELVPGFVAAAVRRAQLLQGAGYGHKAAKAIETAWRREPHPHLAAAYGALFADEAPLARVKRFERLAALKPDHIESHLALAEAALAARLWGEARRQLAAAGGDDAATGNPPAARICRLMAALEEAEHGNGAAARLWLARAGEAPPDPVFVCANCGAEYRDWQPLCARCRAFDSLVWQVPARAVPALAPYSGSAADGSHAVALIAAPIPQRGSGSAASWPPSHPPASVGGDSAPVDAGRG
jgi:HemY protein